MAAFTVTIANGAPMLAGSPSSGNWGALTWNAFLWGYTNDLPINIGKGIASTSTPDTTMTGFSVGKGIASTSTPDTAVGKNVAHEIAEAQTLDSALGFFYTVVLTNQQTLTGDMEHEYLIDPEGYYHVFPSNTTDGEGRDFPTWAAATPGSATWASGTVTSTVWS